MTLLWVTEHFAMGRLIETMKIYVHVETSLLSHCKSEKSCQEVMNEMFIFNSFCIEIKYLHNCCFVFFAL